jgi:hypothetical protein
MSQCVFFTGYKMHSKRYTSYFPELNMVYDSLPSNNEYFDIILTHSVGIIKALNYCFENKFRPLIIIAMDPPDISEKTIRERYNDMDYNLKKIYDNFYSNVIDISAYPVHVIRNRKNIGYTDKDLYKDIYFYDQDTHYPYQIKAIRDKIVKIVKNITNNKK